MIRDQAKVSIVSNNVSTLHDLLDNLKESDKKNEARYFLNVFTTMVMGAISESEKRK